MNETQRCSASDSTRNRLFRVSGTGSGMEAAFVNSVEGDEVLCVNGAGSRMCDIVERIGGVPADQRPGAIRRRKSRMR